MFTTTFHSSKRGRFVNLAFPNKKTFAQKSKFIYNKRKWKQMFGEIISFKLIIQRMLQENDALPRATDPAVSTLHAKSDTRNLFH